MMRAAMMFLFSISISLCLQTTYAAQVSGRHTNCMGAWVDISSHRKSLTYTRTLQGMKVVGIRGQNAWYPNELNHKAPLAPRFWPPEAEVEQSMPAPAETNKKRESLRGGFLRPFVISGAPSIQKCNSLPTIRHMPPTSLEVEGYWHHDGVTLDTVDGERSEICLTESPSFHPGGTPARPVSVEGNKDRGITVLEVRDKHVWHRQRGVNQLPPWAGKVPGFTASY